MKLISRFVSLECSLSADPNFTGLLQGEHPEFWPELGWSMEKVTFGVQKLSNISETRQDRIKFTIKDQWKVLYALSIGAKINDLR